VVNPDGGTGIRVNGVTYSSEPTWVTASPLDNQNSGTTFNVTLSATGATLYSVAAGSTLPAGTTLAANGYFSGTVNIESETTYSFGVVATDAENQDSSKTFNLTVTVIPPTRLYVWGENQAGQLGQNDTTYRSSPTQVGSGTNWSMATFGYRTTAAIKTDGTLWIWGRNNFGQLGFNDTNHRSSPTQVGSSTNWSVVSTQSFFTLSIKTDGTLWSWGRGLFGALGNNSDYKSSPTQVGTATNWSKFTGGNFCSMATKTDGTLWAWGTNSSGQHGTNNRTSTDSPVQVGSGTNWNLVSMGVYSAAAVKTDGTLWLWGRNSYGQLGLGDSTNRSSPVQVGTGTDWSKVSHSGDHALATKTNGTLWAWGQNTLGGNLGINDTIARSSPVQVGTGTNWSLISAGRIMSVATKTDGTLWTWGRNSVGQLGLNTKGTVNYKSSPTQVGTATNWTLISAGSYGAAAISTN